MNHPFPLIHGAAALTNIKLQICVRNHHVDDRLMLLEQIHPESPGT